MTSGVGVDTEAIVIVHRAHSIAVGEYLALHSASSDRHHTRNGAHFSANYNYHKFYDSGRFICTS